MRGAWTVALLCATATVAYADGTYEYTVKPGDSCVSIAAHELGDRSAYPKIHALNPNLGPMPHTLRPGQVLILPAGASQADARLTAARGDVKVRKPTLDAWDAAHRGMDLFTAWRVGAEARSSAELTFLDTSRLFLRERTIVVIYGPTVARSSGTTAELESGALESRLAALRKQPLVVTTPSAEARLAQGDQLVTVDATSATVVANFDGAPVKVRGLDAKRRAKGSAVAVDHGMGSKVPKGGRPSRPRPLPPAPAWQAAPVAFLDLAQRGAIVGSPWGAVGVAAKYRVAITTALGADVAAIEVPSSVTAFEVQGVPPGAYTATVATIDGEGFESKPSPAFAFSVYAADVTAPGELGPVAAALVSPPPVAATEPTTAAPPLVIAIGSRITTDGRVRCEPAVITAPGNLRLECATTEGAIVQPVAVVAVAVRACVDDCSDPPTPAPAIARNTDALVAFQLSSSGHVGTNLRAQASASVFVKATTVVTGRYQVTLFANDQATSPATVQFVTQDGTVVATAEVALEAVKLAPPHVQSPGVMPAARPWLELGVAAGARGFADGLTLGNPTDPAYRLRSGPAFTIRGTAWMTSWLGFELEGQLASLVRDATSGHQAIQTARVSLTVRHHFGPLDARLEAGAGIDTIVKAADGPAGASHPDTDLGYAIGVTGGYRLRDRWLLRLDVRDAFAVPDGGIVHGVEALLGVSWLR